MKKSYSQIVQQIEVLKAQAEKLRRQEIDGVVARIKDAIAAYALTPQDLGFGANAKLSNAQNVFKKRGRKPGAAKGSVSKAKVNTVVRFRDANGNSWVGRGPRPTWLREAIANGKSAQDFAV